MNTIYPWLLSEEDIKILQAFEAEIVGQENNDYIVSFADDNGDHIEARIPKAEFEILPYPCVLGACFHIVVYERIKESVKIASIWPDAKHWHPDL